MKNGQKIINSALYGNKSTYKSSLIRLSFSKSPVKFSIPYDRNEKKRERQLGKQKNDFKNKSSSIGGSIVSIEKEFKFKNSLTRIPRVNDKANLSLSPESLLTAVKRRQKILKTECPRKNQIISSNIIRGEIRRNSFPASFKAKESSNEVKNASFMRTQSFYSKLNQYYGISSSSKNQKHYLRSLSQKSKNSTHDISLSMEYSLDSIIKSRSNSPAKIHFID